MLAGLDWTPAKSAIAACVVLGLYTLYLAVQYGRQELQIRRTGGVRAPSVACSPIGGIRWFYGAARAQMRHGLLQYFDDMIEKHSAPATGAVVELQIQHTRYLITRDPEHIKTVLTTKFGDFGKGDIFHTLWRPFLGDSIFTTDGARWHESRSMIRPMFIKDRVSDLVVFERWTGALLKKMHETGTATAAGVDIQDLFYRMTLDVTTDFLFGHAADALADARCEFAEAFNEVQKLQMYLTMLGPFQQYIPRGRYLRGIATIDRFVMPYIEAALALPAEALEKLSNSDRDFTFLHAVARTTRDPRVLRDQLVAVLLAGRDTTAATLSWAVYELAARPDCWRRLRRDVLDKLGRHRTPSYADLKALPYLRHVLNETLRLYPAVPFNLRVALVDTTIPGGSNDNPDAAPVAVLAGDVVVYSPISMQRCRRLYPDPAAAPGGFADPACFAPERWETWSPKAWNYVPFNGGPRICVGQNFALTEMAYVLVRILQKYESIEYVGDWHAQYHEPEIVGRPGQNVRVRLFEEAEVPLPSPSLEKQPQQQQQQPVAV